MYKEVTLLFRFPESAVGIIPVNDINRFVILPDKMLGQGIRKCGFSAAARAGNKDDFGHYQSPLNCLEKNRIRSSSTVQTVSYWTHCLP